MPAPLFKALTPGDFRTMMFPQVYEAQRGAQLDEQRSFVNAMSAAQGTPLATGPAWWSEQWEPAPERGEAFGRPEPAEPGFLESARDFVGKYRWPIAGGLGLMGLLALLNRRDEDKEKQGSIKAADNPLAGSAVGSLGLLGALLGGAQAPGGYGARGLLRGGIAGAGAGLGSGVGFNLARLLEGSGQSESPTIGQLLGRLIGAGGGYGLANMAMGPPPWEREEQKRGGAASWPPFFGLRRLRA
jgi:hypothetical protein